MKGILPLLLTLASALISPAQNLHPGPLDLPGLEVKSTDSFAGSNLFGYINGGADLYLEYGFRKVAISEYTAGEENLKLEVWVMDDAAAAFGIYALSTYRCISRDELSAFSCESKYQSAAAYGNFYISAVNRSGSDRGRKLCNQMVRKIIGMNKQEELKLPDIISGDKFAMQRSTIRYYKGPLGIQNGIPEWSDLLNGVIFTMFTIQVPAEHGSGTLAVMTFPDSGSREKFLANAGLGASDPESAVETDSGMFHSYRQTGELSLLFYESQDSTLFYQR